MGSTTQKQICLILSVAFFFFLTYRVIVNLSLLKTSGYPETHLIQVSLCLFFCFLTLLGGWFTFRVAGGFSFAILSSGLAIVSSIVAGTSIFTWFLFGYLLLLLLLFKLDERFENEIASISVDRESHQNKKNDLTFSYKSKGEAISMLFEKYSTYYNMRKLAEELAESLDVQTLCQITSNRSLDFILRGDIALLSLNQGAAFSLPAASVRDTTIPKSAVPSTKTYSPDIFDLWILKNRRRLIVLDTYQDFRFDIKEAEKNASLRSLIMSPLIQEGRVIGSLRINSSKPEVFSNDDLRLLDNIAVLGAAAISNAILFEQTKELAIKDFLTGLFVRRYFFDRLKDEHRRALLTNHPLSVLMCDLDFFKQCNDRYGHGAGDQMLIHFANILKASTENAIVARYGGEEFSVLLPETSRQQAFTIANRIRENLKHTPFIIRREKIQTTVSIGVSNLPEDTLDCESLVQIADQALYEAKRKGRDQVC